MSSSFCDCVNQWEKAVGLQVLKDTKYLSLRTRGVGWRHTALVPLFLRSWQDNVDIRLGGENYLESSQSHQLLACTSILCLVHCVLHGDTSWQYSYTFAPHQSAQVKATLSVHTAMVATIALNSKCIVTDTVPLYHAASSSSTRLLVTNTKCIMRN